MLLWWLSSLPPDGTEPQKFFSGALSTLKNQIYGVLVVLSTKCMYKKLCFLDKIPLIRLRRCSNLKVSRLKNKWVNSKLKDWMFFCRTSKLWEPQKVFIFQKVWTQSLSIYWEVFWSIVRNWDGGLLEYCNQISYLSSGTMTIKCIRINQ